VRKKMPEDKPDKLFAPDELLDAVRNHLIRSGYRAGDRIETEQQLAGRFRVSRSRMREVTTTLCQLGVLESRPRRGTILKSFDPVRAAEHVGFHFAVAGLNPADSWEARTVIEEAVLPLVVRRATPAALSEMRDAIRRMERRAQSVRQVYAADRDFHLLMLKSCGNRTLQAFAQVIINIFDRQYRGLRPSPELVTTSIEEHWSILKAVEEGDLRTARRILRRHLGGKEAHRRPWPDSRRRGGKVRAAALAGGD